MKPHAALGLVLAAILLGFVHLAMYVPGGVSTHGLIALGGLALMLVVWMGVGGARRLRHDRPDPRTNNGTPQPESELP